VAQRKQDRFRDAPRHRYCPLLVVVRARRRLSTRRQGAGGLLCGQAFTVTVGFSPGGIFDLYARILARHIGQHIPAAQRDLQNMPRRRAAGVSRTHSS